MRWCLGFSLEFCGLVVNHFNQRDGLWWMFDVLVFCVALCPVFFWCRFCAVHTIQYMDTRLIVAMEQGQVVAVCDIVRMKEDGACTGQDIELADVGDVVKNGKKERMSWIAGMIGV